MRFDAGDLYRVVYEAAGAHGRDQLRVRTGGNGQPVNDWMIDASRWLKAVEAQLNAEDRSIVRLVCGEGFWPSEAVRAAAGHPHYDKAVVPRFNEARPSGGSDPQCAAMAGVRVCGSPTDALRCPASVRSRYFANKRAVALSAYDPFRTQEL